MKNVRSSDDVKKNHNRDKTVVRENSRGSVSILPVEALVVWTGSPRFLDTGRARLATGHCVPEILESQTILSFTIS